MNTRAIAKALALTAALILCAGLAQAQVTKTLDSAEIVNGYMNVFELDGTTFLWGSGWGVADLCASFNGMLMTFTPNTIGDPDPYWYIGGGAPGAAGNKVMEANAYAQVDDGSLSGIALTFEGVVSSYSLTSAHVARAFIRDFAPDFSSVNETYFDINGEGNFSVTLNTIADPARHVQWGVQMKGVNVWVTDVAAYGAVVLGPTGTVDNEAASWGEVKSLFR